MNIKEKVPLNPKVRNTGIAGIITALVMVFVVSYFGNELSPEMKIATSSIVLIVIQYGVGWFTLDPERAKFVQKIEKISKEVI